MAYCMITSNHAEDAICLWIVGSEAQQGQSVVILLYLLNEIYGRLRVEAVARRGGLSSSGPARTAATANGRAI